MEQGHFSKKGKKMNNIKMYNKVYTQKASVKNWNEFVWAVSAKAPESTVSAPPLPIIPLFTGENQ